VNHPNLMTQNQLCANAWEGEYLIRDHHPEMGVPYADTWTDEEEEESNKTKLASAESFAEVFEIVKRAVDHVLGAHRAGLTLVLGDIPNSVGAYHEMGSNAIVMNRNLMKIVWRATNSRERRNAYTFMILLHEYLHTLGFTDDGQVRDLSRRITDDYIGKGHIAAEMAVSPLDKFFPEINQYALFRDRGRFETVHRFDTSSTPYIA
jgi:hypothetical protein